MSMTIKTFSSKTGITPSALRYYENKKLLMPSQRQDNGYRLYSDEQIPTALMIHSLRQADLPIQNIRMFLDAEESEKTKWIQKWRNDVDAKISLLKIARQYLGGVDPTDSHGINLIKWDKPVTFIWFKHSVMRRKQPFAECIDQDQQCTKKLGIALNPGVYIKTLQGNSQTIEGEVGFTIKDEPISIASNWKDCYVEVIQPTLFAMMKVNASNEFLCFNYMQVLQKYGFYPVGQKLERYEDIHGLTYDLLIPVMKDN